MVDIDDIIPYKNNPRINDEAVEYVINLIKEVGYVNPIVLDKDNVIINGHTRLKAVQKLGFKKVACIIKNDLTPEQVKMYRLADNKVSEISGWDYELLESELAEIIDFNMEDFGFAQIGDLDIDDMEFTKEGEVAQKPPKMIKCPHCGKEFEA